MKTIYTILIVTVFAAATSMVSAQDYPDEYLGLPGDNLNLYAVMNLFQESETLEAFEKSLNEQENTINNLDLNGDKYVDYITVSDYVNDNIHNIVLRTALSKDEQQDIAVFVVEKLGNNEVEIQLIGDEALYGPNYIVEPIYAETPNPGYTGVASNNAYTTSYYDIAYWPVIRFIYHPRYVVWRSAWYWDYYPSYWHAWTPHYWHYYYGYHSHWHNHYYSRYRHWNRYRCRSYNTYYVSNVRVYSRTVNKYVTSGRYRDTYSRPAQRRAGEQHYAQTAERRRTNAQTRNNSTVTRSTNRGNRTTATRQNTQSRSNPSLSRSATQSSRSTISRSNSQRSNPAVKTRTSVQRPSSSVTRSRTQSRSKPSLSRSSSQSSRSTVSRSSSQRSNPAVKSRSSVSRSKPSVSRSSSPSRSKSSVSRSSSQGRSKSSVSRSSSSKSRSSASRSSKSSSGKSGSRTSKSGRR